MKSKSLEEELFDIVYQWGRVGIVTDYTAPTYQRLTHRLKLVGANKVLAELSGYYMQHDGEGEHKLAAEILRKADEVVNGLLTTDGNAKLNAANAPTPTAPTSVNREEE